MYMRTAIKSSNMKCTILFLILSCLSLQRCNVIASSPSASITTKTPTLTSATAQTLLSQTGQGLNIPSFRRRNSDPKSSNTIPASSFHSYYKPKRFPTISYTPGLKPWSLQRSRPRSRYQRSNSIFGSQLLEDLSTKLLASNIIVFGLQTMNPAVTALGAKVSHLVKAQPHRLFTPMFLHGGIGHLMMNCYSLRNIGPSVESLFGPHRFLATYVVSGVAGNVLSAMMTPNPSVGASGAIFGLIGAYYVFLQRNQVRFHFTHTFMSLHIILATYSHSSIFSTKIFFGASGERGMESVQKTLFMNLVFGISSRNIDNWGHIGGAMGGATMAYLFGPKLYLMDLGGGRQILVDKPLLRFPQKAKNPWFNLNAKWHRLKRKIQMEDQYSMLPGRPWEKMRQQK